MPARFPDGIGGIAITGSSFLILTLRGLGADTGTATRLQALVQTADKAFQQLSCWDVKKQGGRWRKCQFKRSAGRISARKSLQPDFAAMSCWPFQTNFSQHFQPTRHMPPYALKVRRSRPATANNPVSAMRRSLDIAQQALMFWLTSCDQRAGHGKPTALLLS